MGPCITDVPKSVLQDVIIKLPTKSIIMCKSVCKTWHSLISDPAFAKLHFAQAEAYPMVRPADRRSVSRNLFLVEPEDSSGFDLKDHDCNRSRVHMNLSKYKFPLRHAEELLDYHRNGNVMPSHETEREVHMKITQIDDNNNEVDFGDAIAYMLPYDHNKYNLVNSCNGLLCLSDFFVVNYPAVVCNPITGEFINLPHGPKHEKAMTLIGSGLGFSPRTNEYKVVRILKEQTPDPYKVVEIHTLGTGSWKSVETAPCSDSQLSFPTWVKGMLYWFCYDWRCVSVISFDLDTEEFQSVPSLPFQEGGCDVSMGDLGGRLCLCKTDCFEINVWVMNDSGPQKLWMKKISIRTGFSGRWPGGVYIPMKYFKNDGLLMFNSRVNAFFYYHPGNHSPFIYLKLREMKKYSSSEAISHVPSFISLKDILVGKDVEILNINSRCAVLKLPGETEALSLVEENASSVRF